MFREKTQNYIIFSVLIQKENKKINKNAQEIIQENIISQ